MSRSIKLFLAAVLLSGLGQTFVLAAPKSDKSDKDRKEGEVPPWMEKVDRGGRSAYLIPKGAKVEEVKGGAVVVEPPSEYAARLFYEIDKRQAAMEKELATIKKEWVELREQCALQQQNPDEKAP